jgi:hypothetical protein
MSVRRLAVIDPICCTANLLQQIRAVRADDPDWRVREASVYWLEPRDQARSEGGPPPFAHKVHPELEREAVRRGLVLVIPHFEVCLDDPLADIYG